jgi:hypothetical protein
MAREVANKATSPRFKRASVWISLRIISAATWIAGADSIVALSAAAMPVSKFALTIDALVNAPGGSALKAKKAATQMNNTSAQNAPVRL